MFRIALGGLIVLAAPLGAPAATAVFDVRPAGGGTSVTVAPGDVFDYEVTIRLSEGDNDGLYLFQFHLRTNLGVAQSPADAFAPQVASDFTLFTSLGTPSGDDIEDIFASQNLFPTAVGFAVGQTEVLVTGSLQAPAAEGDYTVTVTPVIAGVLEVGCHTAGCNFDATAQAGPGFTVHVDASATPSGDDDSDVQPDDGSDASDEPAGADDNDATPDDSGDSADAGGDSGPGSDDDAGTSGVEGSEVGPAPSAPFCGASLPTLAVPNLLGLALLAGWSRRRSLL